MLDSEEFEENQRGNTEQRRTMIKQWAEYIRTHGDEEWSRQQNKLINSQLQSVNDLAENW